MKNLHLKRFSDFSNTPKTTTEFIHVRFVELSGSHLLNFPTRPVARFGRGRRVARTFSLEQCFLDGRPLLPEILCRSDFHLAGLVTQVVIGLEFKLIWL